MINFYGFATLLFGNLVDKYFSSFDFVKNSLSQANIKIPFRTYMSLTILTSTIIYLLSLVGLLIFFSFKEIQLPMKIVLLVFLPFILSCIIFAVFNFYPIQRGQSRRTSIETNLPFVLTHMGAIAESGVPPYIIFKLIAEFEEYGEVSEEMKKLVRNIDRFGIDPLTAVKELAEKTPSTEFRQVLLGIASATETGGNVKLYLKNAGEQALFNWKIKREKFMQQLSAYAEFYTGILIAAPLFIISLFSVMNMIQPTIAGFDILFLTKLSIYVLVPLLNIGFILFLHSIEVEM